MADFSMRPGDDVVITGKSSVGNFAIDAPRGTKRDSNAKVRITTGQRTRVDNHVLQFDTCDPKERGVLRTGEDYRVVLKMPQYDFVAHPDGGDLVWEKAGTQGNCHTDVERFQFVTRSTGHPNGAPLCPGMNTELRVHRFDQAKPWMVQPPSRPGIFWDTSNVRNLDLDTDTFSNWKVWRTSGYAYDGFKCKPWKMDNLSLPVSSSNSTKKRIPYTCNLEQDDKGKDICSCTTTVDQMTLFSTQAQCEAFANSKKNGKNNGTNNGKNNGTNNGKNNGTNNGTNNGKNNGTNNGGKKPDEPDEPEDSEPWSLVAAGVIAYILLVIMLLYYYW